MDDAIGLLGSEAIAAARSSSQGGQDARSAAARPDGVNRELYALLQQESDGLPPLIPTARPGPTSYKDRKAGGTKWDWKPFRSSARSDKMTLKHWWKKHESPDDYSFARFNKRARVLKYTKEEYEHAGRDDNWSKDETDHLFELCERFELKWVVIQDRYQSYPTPLPQRSIEDIKNRYYSIVKKLKPTMLPEQLMLDENSSANGIRRVIGYDPEYDRQRKQKLAQYYARTGGQERTDTKTVEEAKKIESSRKRRERESSEAGLWKGIGRADAAALALCDEAVLSHLGGKMKRTVFLRRRILPEPPTSRIKTQTGSSAAGVAGRTSRRASAVDNALEDIGIDTADPEAFQYVPGIEAGKPLMPTEGIHCALYQLRGHLYTFFELQAEVQEKEELLQKLKGEKTNRMRKAQSDDQKLKRSPIQPSAGAQAAASALVE